MKGNIPTAEEILQALPAEDEVMEVYEPEPESAEVTPPVQPVFDDARLERIENLLLRFQKNQSLALELGGRIDSVKRDEMNSMLVSTVKQQQAHLQTQDRLIKEIHRLLEQKIQPEMASLRAGLKQVESHFSQMDRKRPEDAITPFVDKFSRQIDRLMQRVTTLEVQADTLPEQGLQKPGHEFMAEEDFLS